MREGPLRIIIPGGSGQIGRLLARHFRRQNHFVTVIARHPQETEWDVLLWDGRTLGSWASAFDGADVVINLAGHTVNCRYNAHNRREILESRVNTTRLVGEAIAAASPPPAVWLNASTATIYRHSFDRPMDEEGELGGFEPEAPRKWRFTADVARAWEQAFLEAPTPHTRKVALRTAIVMSPDADGVFDRLLWLVRVGLGGPAGSGRQFVSWIHEMDFIRAIEFLIERDDLSGPINIASPAPIPNREFMHCLRQAWCPYYIGLPLPRPILEIGAIFLSTETELLLKSRRVVPGRLLAAGFEFHFPQWRGACCDLVERWRAMRT